MVYCQRCGKQNEDGAQFCNKCGASLAGPRKDYSKEWEDRCERECTEGSKSPLIWGIIVILIGLFIIFEFALERLPNVPNWVEDFPFCGIGLLIIGLIVIAVGVKAVTSR